MCRVPLLDEGGAVTACPCWTRVTVTVTVGGILDRVVADRSKGHFGTGLRPGRIQFLTDRRALAMIALHRSSARQVRRAQPERGGGADLSCWDNIATSPGGTA